MTYGRVFKIKTALLLEKKIKRKGMMKLPGKTGAVSSNPAGGAVFGGWRRCSSVGEHCGYPPSSENGTTGTRRAWRGRLASHQNRLPQHHSDFENTPSTSLAAKPTAGWSKSNSSRAKRDLLEFPPAFAMPRRDQSFSGIKP
jgi:hypothetical protein